MHFSFIVHTVAFLTTTSLNQNCPSSHVWDAEKKIEKFCHIDEKGSFRYDIITLCGGLTESIFKSPWGTFKLEDSLVDQAPCGDLESRSVIQSFQVFFGHFKKNETFGDKKKYQTQTQIIIGKFYVLYSFIRIWNQIIETCLDRIRIIFYNSSSYKIEVKKK